MCEIFRSRNGSVQAAVEEAVRNAAEPANCILNRLRSSLQSRCWKQLRAKKQLFTLLDAKTLMPECWELVRPFVIEVSKPKKRFVDLKEIEAKINAEAVGKG